MTSRLTRSPLRKELASQGIYLAPGVRLKRVGNKYRAKRTPYGGRTFASKAEAKRYAVLKLMERAGEIRDLRLQPRYPLTVNDRRLGTYVGDFCYFDIARGREIVEDVKAPVTRTPLYLLKKALMEAIHGIEIQEVG